MVKTKFFRKLKKTNYEPVIHILSILVVLVFIINLVFITSLTSTLKQKISEAEEEARPADLQLTIINADCDNCFDINTVIQAIKSGNVNITKEEILSASDAKNLIQEYNIEKLPNVIVKGELSKTNLNKTMLEVNDALIFADQSPPFYDVNDKRIKGLVEITIINPENCPKCNDINNFVDEIKANHVEVTKVSSIEENQAGSLIELYNILRLPAMILSKDASEYKLIAENWGSLGTKENDGNLVLRTVIPPYKNISTGEIDGLVDVTYLVDASCTECYDVNEHKSVMSGYGIIVSAEKSLDISSAEGREFAQKNNITLVPTVIFSKDVKVYTSFYNVLLTVGRETDEGDVVFTSLELMGIHKNINTGEIIGS